MAFPSFSPGIPPSISPLSSTFCSSFSSHLFPPSSPIKRNDQSSSIPPTHPHNEDIYVANSSIISLYSDGDTSSRISLFSSDQSHYNFSTSSSSSCLSPRSGLTNRSCDSILRTVHQHRDGWKGYESQSLSLWIDVVLEENEEEEKPGDEDLYESIYEVIPPLGREFGFQEISEEDEYNKKNNGSNSNVSNLSEIAEAAGRKMKKFRKNLSLKKKDITRSLSKIRRNSRTVFYEGLTIKEKETNYSNQDSDVSSNTYSHSSANSVLDRLSSTCRPIPPARRKNSSKVAYSVIRPTVAPPSPPISPPSLSSIASSHLKQPTPTITTVSYSHAGYLAMAPKIMSVSSNSMMLSKISSFTDLPKSTDLFKSSEIVRQALISIDEEKSRKLLCIDSYPGCKMTAFGVGTRYENKIGQNDSGLPSDPLKGLRYSGEIIDNSNLQLPDIEETYISSLFQTEPLYQFYDINHENLGSSGSSSGDNYEGCENMYECMDALTPEVIRSKLGKTPLPSRSSAMDLVTTTTGRRSLWAELPEIIESGILATITTDTKKTQEAMFEVISSEASYLKSLNILISHFIQSPKFGVESGMSVITKIEQKNLFADVIRVRTCSEQFLADLEKRWQGDLLLSGICEIVRAHAKQNFPIYVKYCSNKVYQDRTLRKLKLENPAFVEALKELESSPTCQSLSMHSFLMLPMQRITRLPLLIEAIQKRLPPESSEQESCTEALNILNQIVRDCNESARSMERIEELLILSQKFDFKDIKAIPLISASRWLIKRGEGTRISWKEMGDSKLTFGRSDSKLTFGRRIHKHSLTLFLFTDLLLITKKKSDDNFVVLDYCPRNMINISGLDPVDVIPALKSINDAGFLLWLTLLQNHENRTQEMLFSFPSEKDRLKWTEAITPATSEVPGEKIYEEWDAPKVEAVDDYDAEQDTELSMQKGETGSVHRKLSEGWLFVERSSDGSKGWIPETAVKEIESSHIRAKNFKQRYAFLKLLNTDYSTTDLFKAQA